MNEPETGQINTDCHQQFLPAFEQWLDRQNLSPEGAEAANEIVLFLKMPVIPGPLRWMFADAVLRLATAFRGADPTWRQ
jgi:hypothetical protein